MSFFFFDGFAVCTLCSTRQGGRSSLLLSSAFDVVIKCLKKNLRLQQQQKTVPQSFLLCIFLQGLVRNGSGGGNSSSEEVGLDEYGREAFDLLSISHRAKHDGEEDEAACSHPAFGLSPCPRLPLSDVSFLLLPALGGQPRCVWSLLLLACLLTSRYQRSSQETTAAVEKLYACVD
jgi:hypothetical protein